MRTARVSQEADTAAKKMVRVLPVHGPFLSDRCRCYQPRARTPCAPLPLPPAPSRTALPSSTVRLAPPRTIEAAAPVLDPAATDRTRPLRQRCVMDAPRLGLRAAFGKSRAPRFRCRGDDVGALPPRPHQNYGDFLSGRLMDSRTAAPMHKVLSKIDARMVQAAWAMWTHSVSWSRGVDRLMRDYDQVVRARAL